MHWGTFYAGIGVEWVPSVALKTIADERPSTTARGYHVVITTGPREHPKTPAFALGDSGMLDEWTTTSPAFLFVPLVR